MRAALLPLVALAACSAVEHSYVVPDWTSVERQPKHLVVVTAPLPAGDPAAATLWSQMTKRWVNQHRDFIVKDAQSGATLDPAVACVEGIDAVLHLAPTVEREDGGMAVGVHARLLRCGSSELVWEAQAGGSWASEDDTVAELTTFYAKEIGDAVKPFVAPSFHLLRETLDTLPRPTLNDDEVMEKIELGE